MPQFLIEAPVGIRDDAKRRMMEGVTAAIDEAYGIPDIRIWLREYPAGNVAQNGRLNAEPVRPLCFLEAPELRGVDDKIKRRMVERIQAAIGQAYQGIANTDRILILMNHYPLEDAAEAGRLHSDNPAMVEAVRRVNEMSVE